ncbi:MAG: zinc metallopeptidase [Hyphomicrobiaceae bacterium]|nr:zinc metallopeptidase [Hyphomicrobiaceae bacterium]
MKWQGRKQSSHMEDRRGAGGTGGMFRGPSGGPGFRLPSGGTPGGAISGGGIGLIVVVVIVGLMLGVNPMDLLSGGVTPSQSPQTQNAPSSNANEDQLYQFMAVVAQDTEDLWTEVFKQNNMTYTPPTIVVYSGQTSAGCGVAQASMGPFYCPADQNVYLDLSFYDQLRRQFGAPGDFAQAYVLAHEIGHHVQQLTGVLPEFNQRRQRMSETDANAYSVRIELQADCYAGIWANYAGKQNLLDSGDVEEALNAAEQIGDDTLQKKMQGFAVPKTFNHGTSEQRKRWFGIGARTGDVGQCDTLNAQTL